MPQLSKGVRIQQTSRIPVDIHRRVVATARTRGHSFNDVLVAALREHLSYDEPNVGERQNLQIYNDAGEVVGTV